MSETFRSSGILLIDTLFLLFKITRIWSIIISNFRYHTLVHIVIFLLSPVWGGLIHFSISIQPQIYPYKSDRYQ
ncbi:hypothetical protein DK846_08140 [Methanospirillum lacunae]|uniref:Uncharacterized protein n=1 Tax=Methanospirillum lacunae TaxID=668570 RepID=A0A2V2N6U7_9EURY|nr:hypothetical protein DK846_08140 [Methanospirillum lacunae]